MLKPTSSASAGRDRLLAAACLACLALLSAAAGARQAGDEELPQTPAQRALREVAIAEAASREAQQLRRHPDFSEAVSRDGEVEAVLKRAQRNLQTAKSDLARAEQTGSATGFSDSALLARSATRTFGRYEKALHEILAQIEAERSPRPPPPPPPPPEPAPSTTGEGETVPAPDPQGTAAEPSPPPEPAAEPAPPPPPPPPPQRSPRRPPMKLRQAADAYFAGDYEAAISRLSESSFRQGKSRAHALLLRAAARYTLFLLGGENDYALRGQAAEDVTACKAADPELGPDEALFSPRFRDFFAAAR